MTSRATLLMVASALVLTGVVAGQPRAAEPVPATPPPSEAPPTRDEQAAAAGAALERGRALAAQERPDEALAALHRAVALYPSYPLALNEIGVILARQGDLNGAIEHLRLAVGHDPGFAAAWSNLGEALRRSGDHEASVGAYGRALDLDDEQPAVWYALAASLKELGRPSEALGALEEYDAVAIPTDPRRQEVGAAIASLGGRGVEPAAPTWTPAPIPDVPPPPEPEERPSVVMPEAPTGATERDGDVAFGRRRYLAALAAYREADRQAPGDADIAYKIGATLAVMGDPRGALRAWRRAVTLEPTRPFLYRHAAFAGRWRAQREDTPLALPDRTPDEALAAAEAALATDQPALVSVVLAGRDDPAAQRLLGEAALLLGRFEAAMAAFQLALAADAGDRHALGGLAEALLRLDQDEEAEARIRAWSDGAGLDPAAFVVRRSASRR